MVAESSGGERRTVTSEAATKVHAGSRKARRAGALTSTCVEDVEDDDHEVDCIISAQIEVHMN